MLARDVRRVRLHFVFVIHKLKTAGNIGKKGKKRDVQTEPSGEYCTQHGHTVADLRGQVLEKVKSKDPFILWAREAMLIQKFNTFRRGLIKEPWFLPPILNQAHIKYLKFSFWYRLSYVYLVFIYVSLCEQGTSIPKYIRKTTTPILIFLG